MSIGIKQDSIKIESHRFNGRVERVFVTIRETIVKLGEMKIKVKIRIIENKFNET